MTLSAILGGVSRARTRELVVGHFAIQDFDFWPLCLVEGCLLGAVMVSAQLTAVCAGGIGSLLVESRPLQTLLPTMMLLALWAISEGATALGAKRVRRVIDEEVRATFGLTGPRVRAATDRPDDEAHAEVEDSARSEKENAL